MDLTRFLDDFMNKDDLGLLAKDVYGLLKCPVMVVDVSFRVMAWFAPATFTDKPFRSSVERGSLTYEASSYLVGDPARQDSYVTLTDSPFRRRFTALAAGGVKAGYLILVDVRSDLDKTGKQVFGSIETALAKQLLLETSRSGPVQDSGEALIQSLLEGNFEDASLFELQAKAAGLERFAPARLVMANLDLYHSTAWEKNTLRHAILAGFPLSHPMLHQGVLLMFPPRDPDEATLRALAREYRLRVIVSETLAGITDLPTSYEVLRRIMEYLLPRTPHPFVAYAEAMRTLMRLRRLVAAGETATPELMRLARQDAQEHTAYCETLYTYMCCSHSLARTSERLYTHRNTILYRIRRLKEDYGLPLDDPGEHLRLIISCALALVQTGREDMFLPDLSLDEDDEEEEEEEETPIE